VDKWTQVSLELVCHPLRRDGDGLPWKWNDTDQPHVIVRSPKRAYPKTLQWIRREFKDSQVRDDLKDWWDLE
jgi:hypothetical protein